MSPHTSATSGLLFALAALAGCASLRLNVGATSDLDAHAGVEATTAVTWLIEADPDDRSFGGPTLVLGANRPHDGREGMEGVLGPGVEMTFAPDGSPVGLRGALRAVVYVGDARLAAAGLGAEAGFPFVIAGPDFGSSDDEPRLLLGPYVAAQTLFGSVREGTARPNLARGTLGLSLELFSTTGD